MRCVEAWASGEFGHAVLGDARRTRRLIQVAAEVARHPAGTVTRACRSSATREGAFRLLEKRAILSQDVGRAAETAGAGRCTGQKLVVVAVDATSLSLTDRGGEKGLGAVGSWSQGSRGLHAMTALAVDALGSTLGVCAQH